jgi:hypothetical protein
MGHRGGVAKFPQTILRFLQRESRPAFCLYSLLPKDYGTDMYTKTGHLSCRSAVTKEGVSAFSLTRVTLLFVILTVTRGMFQ